MTKKKEAAKVAEKKEQKPVTKFQKVRDFFAKNQVGTLDVLTKVSGFDERNVKTAMSILRNPKRTKTNLLVTTYDREKRTFTRS
jgi:hypothetical protein